MFPNSSSSDVCTEGKAEDVFSGGVTHDLKSKKKKKKISGGISEAHSPGQTSDKWLQTWSCCWSRARQRWQWALMPEDERSESLQSFFGEGGDVVSVEKVITGKVSVKCCCLPSGRGQDKTYPHLLLHKQAGSEKKYNQLFSFFFKHTAKYFWLHILAWYLGHLNHVGELGKAGNGNHIMEGFKLCAERQRNSLKSQNAHCSVSNPKKSPGCFNDFFSIDALHSCKWTVGSKGTFPIDAVCGWVYNDLYIWCVWAKIAWERVKRASLLFQFSESKEKLHAERVLQSEHPRYPLNFMMQQPKVFWKLTF